MALLCVITVLCFSSGAGAQGQSFSAENVHDAPQRVEEKQPSPFHFIFSSSAKLIPDPQQKSLNPLFNIPFYYFFLKQSLRNVQAPTHAQS